MKVTHDKEHNTAFIQIADDVGDGGTTHRVASIHNGGTELVFNLARQLVGVTLLDAKAQLPLIREPPGAPFKYSVQKALADRLVSAELKGLKYHVEFEITLSSLAYIRLEKCIEYGESRYEETDAEFNRWMLFSDVHRKYIRLRQQLLRKDDAGLLESYRDMANYCIMAVQIHSRTDGVNS
jgi:hypothetical protein